MATVSGCSLFGISMANLDGSSVSDYSDSFELDCTNSEGFSHDEVDVLSELKKTLNASVEADPSVPLNKNDGKPPAPKREKRPHPSGGGLDLRKTVRSPVAMSHHLNRDGSPTKISDMIDGTNSPCTPTITPRSSPAAKPLRFRQAVGTVQNLQLTVKKFQNSDEVREVVFKEWLAKKEVKDLRTRQSLSESERTEAENKRKKEVALSKRSSETVKKWNASKEIQLQSKKQQMSAEAKQQAEKIEERLNRTQEGKQAAERWREEKKKIGTQRHIEKKKKKEEEERRKKEEKEEKLIEDKQAFQSWSQRKDGVLKEKAKKMKAEAKKLELTQQQQISEKRIEANKSYDAWKAKKDERIKRTKALYTYNEKPAAREKPWRPARAMQYSYPKSKERKPKAKGKAKDSSHGSMESYSMSSFESEADVETSCSEHSSASSVMDSVSRTASPTKGRHKTIEVCCQTLQYWCTCDTAHETGTK